MNEHANEAAATAVLVVSYCQTNVVGSTTAPVNFLHQFLVVASLMMTIVVLPPFLLFLHFLFLFVSYYVNAKPPTFFSF